MLEQLVLALGTGCTRAVRASGAQDSDRPTALFLAVVALASSRSDAACRRRGGLRRPALRTTRVRICGCCSTAATRTTPAAWPPVFAAIMVAEGCLLGWITERTIRPHA
jgi:hypothetical protein